MDRKIKLLLLVTVSLATASLGHAQQDKKIRRFGVLSVTSAATIPSRVDAFRQGLRELGHMEGKISSLNIAMGMENWIGSLRSLPSWCALTSR